jgi:hypothetical protein
MAVMVVLRERQFLLEKFAVDEVIVQAKTLLGP